MKLTPQMPRLLRKASPQVTATIRPDKDKTRQYERVRTLIEECDVSHLRINLSHFRYESMEEREAWADLIRCIHDLRIKLKLPVAIMLDTAGPEFRVISGKVLEIGPREEFTLKGGGDAVPEDERTITISMPEGASFGGADIVGREIRFKDGACIGNVTKQFGPLCLQVRAKHAMQLTKGGKVNFPDFPLPGVSSVSLKDQEQLAFLLNITKTEFAQEQDPKRASEAIPIEFVAQSFVRHPEDIQQLFQFLGSLNLPQQPLIIAKIETKHAVKRRTLNAIVAMPEVAGVMIARGDLASECERWQVPAKQREIIRVAQSMLKPVMVATEVYSSMGDYPYPWQPNRGEVTDARHAMEAGVDGIVFTKETGARPDPETTVKYFLRQAEHDQKDIRRLDLWRAERERRRHRLTNALHRILRGLSPGNAPLPWHSRQELNAAEFDMGADFRANARHAPIVVVTEDGSTVANLVHFLPHAPIIAITSTPRTLAKLTLFRNVHPALVDSLDENFSVHDLKTLVLEIMEKFQIGDEVVALMPRPTYGEIGVDIQILVRRKVNKKPVASDKALAAVAGAA